MKIDYDFTFRRCGAEQLDTICDIQEETLSLLEDDRLLRRNSREALASCLEHPHVTIGVFSGEEMAAFGILYRAGNSEDNLGCLLGLSGDALERTAAVKLTIVRPAYRGYGLQRRLIELLEHEAGQLGIERLCATASPANIHSLRNFTAAGYDRCGRVTVYGGLERELFYKKLK